METENRRIAILGAGPSGMFMLKRLIESGVKNTTIEIFERKSQVGAGMPYSIEGANREHITNVSANEIPAIVTSLQDWVNTVDKSVLQPYNITPKNFNEYKVVPRLLFGKYLESQFGLLCDKAREAGFKIVLRLGTSVTDIIDRPELKQVLIEIEGVRVEPFDAAIICTGHIWTKEHEGKVQGYFDSPYPPAKLHLELNHSVAIRGSSLTAIDAIRTLARSNGKFVEDNNGMLRYIPLKGTKRFKMVMHSRNGLLPAVRFHLEDSHLHNDSLLTPEEIEQHKRENNGFLSLDYIFEKDYKDLFKEKDSALYERIKDLRIEEFVALVMGFRENADPFELLRKEYAEAEQSIQKLESVYWKELLAVLSFAMNYPAKYLSAEDMLRLQKTLMPLISIVIAFVPQTSCRELLALHDAGKLEIISVGQESDIEINDNGGITYHYYNESDKECSAYFETFVDCVGQPHLSFEDFPFKSLVKDNVITPATLRFRSDSRGKEKFDNKTKNVQKEGEHYILKVPGVTINDSFQIVGPDGLGNERLFVMAVPYIGGFNPDYSGLDFCEEASLRIANHLECSKL
ncbi:MAG: hypothetical protein DI539_21445 [Flavobacterium psychrophilum]|nr:MAG: hypothetical protein DI539_21445 [Flavobacterium psychrophilum]